MVAELTPSSGGVTDPEACAVLCDAVVRLHCAVERHLFFRASCLERALVLWWQLRRRGVAANLRIGARKEQDRFEAHAWVEVAGQPLLDADSTHTEFVPLHGPVELMENQRS